MESYLQHVRDVERQLGMRPQATIAEVCTLITGGNAVERYNAIYSTEDGRAKLQGRTPISLDRDRVLYSDPFRRQDDKYHILFFGKTRRSRNYTSHTVKAAHMARIAATRLLLNGDLAEAIVLGSKVGGVPFLHIGKTAVANWVEKKLLEINKESPGQKRTRASKTRPRTQPSSMLEIPVSQSLAPEPPTLPKWLDDLDSRAVFDSARSFFPWAAGSYEARAYTSGQQSYWNFATNPFLLESPSEDTTFTAETLYGIWRHSLHGDDATAPFEHEVTLQRSNVTLRLDATHASYEAGLARYCDDFTWALENLAEAARVSAVDQAQVNTFQHFLSTAPENLPASVYGPFAKGQVGKLYTFFIDDLVSTTQSNIEKAQIHPKEEHVVRTVSLSAGGVITLTAIQDYLNKHVFSKSSIKFRNETVDQITRTALGIMYDSHQTAMTPRIEQLARVQGWHTEERQQAIEARLNDPVFRVSACVSLLSTMSDRDIFDFIGLDQ